MTAEVDAEPVVVQVVAKPAGRLPGGADQLRHVGRGVTRSNVAFNVWVYMNGPYPQLHITLDAGADGLPVDGWRVGLTSLVHALLERQPGESAAPIAALRGILEAMPAGEATALDVVGPAVDALETLIGRLSSTAPPPT